MAVEASAAQEDNRNEQSLHTGFRQRMPEVNEIQRGDDSQEGTRDLQFLEPKVLEEVVRQFRASRNDILRNGVWNVRNLTDEEFNHADDLKLLGYFQSDLLETKFLSKGRRVSLVEVWGWFDDLMKGAAPIEIDGQEIYLEVKDKDLEKVRKRIDEIRSFLPLLEEGDLEAFKRAKFKLRRTVMRLTYDIHHLAKRFDKYRKSAGLMRSRSHHEGTHHEAEPAIAEAETGSPR